MATPEEMIKKVSSLLNDSKQSKYKNATVLPYFNMALTDLQEQFELNDIPITAITSGVLPINIGTDRISFTGTSPVLPADLIEIKQLWESRSNQNIWTPMVKKDFLPHDLENIQITSFGIWSWESNEIHLLPSIQPNDLKMDYVRSLFTEIDISQVKINLGVEFKNCQSYLQYRTAAHCAMWIEENELRAGALQAEAGSALLTSMGISVKGQQAIAIRKRPFRYAFKMRRGIS